MLHTRRVEASKTAPVRLAGGTTKERPVRFAERTLRTAVREKSGFGSEEEQTSPSWVRSQTKASQGLVVSSFFFHTRWFWDIPVITSTSIYRHLERKVLAAMVLFSLALTGRSHFVLHFSVQVLQGRAAVL